MMAENRMREGRLVILNREVREDSCEITFAKRPEEVEGVIMWTTGKGGSWSQGQQIQREVYGRKAKPTMGASEVSTKEKTVRGHVREKGGQATSVGSLMSLSWSSPIQ